MVPRTLSNTPRETEEEKREERRDKTDPPVARATGETGEMKKSHLRRRRHPQPAKTLFPLTHLRRKE